MAASSGRGAEDVDVHHLREAAVVHTDCAPLGGHFAVLGQRAILFTRLVTEDGGVLRERCGDAGATADRTLAGQAARHGSLTALVRHQGVGAPCDHVRGARRTLDALRPLRAGESLRAGGQVSRLEVGRPERAVLEVAAGERSVVDIAALQRLFLTSEPVSEPFWTSLPEIVAAA
jgi:hypothetical protein